MLNKGFHVEGIFDADIPTSTKPRRKEAEEDQVQAVVKRKGGFYALLIYTNVGTTCIASIELLMVQMIQLEKDTKQKNENIQKKIDASSCNGGKYKETEKRRVESGGPEECAHVCLASL